MKKATLLATSLLLVACGQQTNLPKSSDNTNSQVINGTFSQAGARPYQVALLNRGRQFCGGTIIAKNWVLTAAHCVSNGSASGLSVRGGSLNSTSGGQEIKVKRVKVHPQYGKGGSETNNDIAVLELSSDFQLNQNVSVAALPTKNVEEQGAAPGQSVIISGWGRYNGDSQSSSNRLREASLQVLTNEACNRELGHLGRVTASMICGATNSQGQTGCHGDSGGPFVSKVGSQFYVFGAVSWGGGGKCTSSTVFARTAHLQPWITKSTGIQPGQGDGGGGGGGGNVFEGTVNTNSSSFQPNGTKGFDWKGGTLAAKLSSNARGDFDLYLQKKEGVRWVDVDSSTNESHSESISYNAAKGLYRWEVYAYEGSGDYKITQSE